MEEAFTHQEVAGGSCSRRELRILRKLAHGQGLKQLQSGSGAGPEADYLTDLPSRHVQSSGMLLPGREPKREREKVFPWVERG